MMTCKQSTLHYRRPAKQLCGYTPCLNAETFPKTKTRCENRFLLIIFNTVFLFSAYTIVCWHIVCHIEATRLAIANTYSTYYSP